MIPTNTFLITVGILFSCFLNLSLSAQSHLSAGPMLGYVDLCEAAVWVQARDKKPVTLHYWPAADVKNKKTMVLLPDTLFANTATFIISRLEPATKYRYTIGNGDEFEFTTQPLWQYRTDPPSFKVAVGSCAFINEEAYDRPGKPYGGDYQIFSSILHTNPDLMIWGGDNVYLREVDFNSRESMYHRYTHARNVPEIQILLSACAHYAIWDDHDFGPNNANGSYIHKDWSFDAFRHFWANPSYGLSDQDCGKGITTQFNWGDIDFFFLDNRYHRVVQGITGQECTILGKMQIEWLIQALKFSQSPFKLVVMGGQFLNTVAEFENYATCPKERQQIINLIQENRIQGVVFITGDRHFTELSKLSLGEGSEIYDLTVSPLTSTAYQSPNEVNTLRVDKTLVTRRNFATLGFSGKKGERMMTISVYDSDGELLWIKSILQPVMTK